MNEQQRQACLRAMGIDLYVPRFILPGARPSAACASPAATEAAEVPAPLAATQAAEAAHAASLPTVPEAATPDALSARAGPSMRSPTSPSPGAAPPPPSPTGMPVDSPALSPAQPPTDSMAAAKPEVDQPRFRLAMFRLGEELCVLNLLPPAGPAHLTPHHERLLRELLAALGFDPNALEAGADFRWPLVDGLELGTGREAARSALRAWLDERAQERSFSRLLLLGTALCPFVLDDESGDARGRLQPVSAYPWDCLASRSLGEALHEPALKRELWRDLAPLRRRR